MQTKVSNPSRIIPINIVSSIQMMIDVPDGFRRVRRRSAAPVPKARAVPLGKATGHPAAQARQPGFG